MLLVQFKALDELAVKAMKRSPLEQGSSYLILIRLDGYATPADTRLVG